MHSVLLFFSVLVVLFLVLVVVLVVLDLEVYLVLYLVVVLDLVLVHCCLKWMDLVLVGLVDLVGLVWPLT